MIRMICYAVVILLGVLIGVAWPRFLENRVDTETEFASFAIPVSAGIIAFTVGFVLLMLVEIFLIS